MPQPPSTLMALIDAGLALVRRTASGRVSLARAHGVVFPELVPEAIRPQVLAELERSYASVVDPFDPKVVAKAARGVDDVSDEPLAVTPAAQVHTASLDGDPVAIKVARPGVAATVRGELVLLDVLVAPLAAVFGALDITGVLRELREAALDELDLGHEGDQQHQLRRALRRVDGLRIPAVHEDESSEGVLVTELLSGETLAAGAQPDDPEALARLLVRAHLTAWREAGLVMTDARPSHVLLMEDGEIGLIGAGVARPVPRDRMQYGVAAFVALADEDPAAFAEAVAGGLEVLGPDEANAVHGILRHILGDLVHGPAKLDGPAVAAMGERGWSRLAELLRVGSGVTPDPADLAAVRMLAQLGALLARLGVTADWPALVAEEAGT